MLFEEIQLPAATEYKQNTHDWEIYPNMQLQPYYFATEISL